jgi:undecaprenyl-phosphate 4-deoxy-4-formamido-L-arabinose transferase
MLISICIPVYNSEKTIARLVKNIKENLKNYNLEIILVNDGSKDNSEKVCSDLALKDKIVKFISLRKNFGEHNAVMCALNYSKGDYVVIIDDDFQNPPQEIIKLVNEARRYNYDVVYSKYYKKKHNIFRNLGSWFNDIVATWLLNKPKNLYLSSFKLIKKEVVKEIIKYKGPFPYIDGLILRVTNNIASVFVEHSKRIGSKSNYTIGKLISLWLNMFVNFSIKPLRLVTFLGMSLSMICLALGIYFIVEKILYPDSSKGWASIIVCILFIGGVQMIFTGIIGEFVGKNYLDRNGTPQWIVKKKIL